MVDRCRSAHKYASKQSPRFGKSNVALGIDREVQAGAGARRHAGSPRGGPDWCWSGQPYRGARDGVTGSDLHIAQVSAIAESRLRQSATRHL
jgi:hypothetical protein